MTSKESDQMSKAEFDRIATIALEEAGIELPRNKTAMIQSRIFRHMRQNRFDGGLSRYLDAILDDSERRNELVSVLTTNVTGFFREPHHFETLRDHLKGLPKARTERIRIWSAGCSGGHEPYSVAMTCAEVWPDADRRDVKILATDIDHDMISRGREGIYSATEVEKISQDKLQKFFVKSKGSSTSFEVRENLRRMVTFRPLNLHADWPMKGSFEAIFCRNVVIYFSEAGRASLWPRFQERLADSGLLFIGHSERIHPISGSGFAAAGTTTFRKVAM